MRSWWRFCRAAAIRRKLIREIRGIPLAMREPKD